MAKTKDAEHREDRRRCRACRQLRPLKDFPLRNRRPIYTCFACRMLKFHTQREAERKEKIRRRLLELGRLIRKGRGTSKRAAALLGELRELCGSLSGVVDEWSALLSDTAQRRPGSPRHLKTLVAVVEAIRLAEQEQAAVSAPPTKKPRRREKPFDPSKLGDDELQRIIEQYEQQQAAKRGRRRDPRRKTGDSG